MKTLYDWLASEPFTLALSSRFFGFYSHCGIATALYEAGLKPQKLTGSSAGALVAAALASGLSPHEVKDIIFSVSRDDFWDPKPGFGILKGQKMISLFEKYFSATFEDAAIPLEVAALDVFSLKTVFLKKGNLPRAVAASCAVPLMFHPVKIEGRVYTDGGVFNKPGLQFDAVTERTLCVYLESTGVNGIYERKGLIKKLVPLHKVLYFKNLPDVHFYTLQGREAAFQQGYSRAKAALYQALDASSMQA